MKRSPLRKFLVAYAKGHNNQIRVPHYLAGYRYKAIRNMLVRMTREGIFTRIKQGWYVLSSTAQHTT